MLWLFYSSHSFALCWHTIAQDRRENWFWFNNMEKCTDRELIHIMQRVLTYIHEDKPNQLFPMCKPNALLKYGQQCVVLRNSAGMIIPPLLGPIRIVWNRKPFVRWLSANSAIVAGTYYAQSPGTTDGKTLHWDCTILFFNKKVIYIQLSHISPSERLHKVSAVNKAIYYLYESDILYLEVIQNHLHWHHRNRIIESIGTLSGIAECLSEDFVRVHRCYIVNKNHVETIQRCGAKQCALTMAGGDVIPIPYNKFVECRDKLTR